MSKEGFVTATLAGALHEDLKHFLHGGGPVRAARKKTDLVMRLGDVGPLNGVFRSQTGHVVVVDSGTNCPFQS